MSDPIHQPRNLEQAAKLAERYAEVDFKIAAIEAVRKADIAKANASADEELTPLLEERKAIAAKIEPWWKKACETLTEGKRKSIELGGCMIGSRAGRATLAIAGDAKEIAAKLFATSWGKKRLVRMSLSIDRAAALRELEGPHAETLAKMGLNRDEGTEQFYIDRVQQGGTIGEQ